MNNLTPAFVAAARASSQTTFETIDRAPDPVALFITDVEDAPLQIIGQLGSDGRWYIGSFAVAPLDKDPDQPDVGEMEEAIKAVLAVAGLTAGDHTTKPLVLRDEPVAERMVRYGIDQFLNAALGGVAAPQALTAFKTRLQASRFRKAGHA